LNKEDLLLLYVFRAITLALGGLLLLSALFFSFSGYLALLIVPAVSLVFTGIYLHPRKVLNARRTGLLVNSLGMASYLAVIVGQFMQDQSYSEIGLFECAVVIALCLSFLLFIKLPAS
jgi:hypothetical protein